MRVFKEVEKGCIKFGSKKYYIVADSATLTLVMADCLVKMEEAKSNAMKLQEEYEQGKMSMSEFVEAMQEKFNVIKRHNERFCTLMLGGNAFEEVVNGCVTFNFDDLQQLTNLLVAELTDMRQAQNKTLVGDLK